MAIKVNGTTVINDSRALQNVASVDAATAAAITAAGVGGGGVEEPSWGSPNLTISTSGTYTFPTIADDAAVWFYLIGGGGGGMSAGDGTPGGGGSGGSAAFLILPGAVVSGASYSVTCGGGGQGINGLQPYGGGATSLSIATFSVSAAGGGGGGYNSSSPGVRGNVDASGDNGTAPSVKGTNWITYSNLGFKAVDSSGIKAVFGGGGGSSSGGNTTNTVSTYGGNGGGSAAAAGIYPGGGSGGGTYGNTGFGGNGNVRIYY